jgi:hypothetical protein
MKNICYFFVILNFVFCDGQNIDGKLKVINKTQNSVGADVYFDSTLINLVLSQASDYYPDKFIDTFKHKYEPDTIQLSGVLPSWEEVMQKEKFVYIYVYDLQLLKENRRGKVIDSSKLYRIYKYDFEGLKKVNWLVPHEGF